MEQLDNTQLIQNFEDILINVNEYCEAVSDKIEVIEEIVVELRADLGKARELTTYFHQTIEQLKLNSLNSSKVDMAKVRSELSELSFRPNQGNASNPLSEEEKEKQQLKAKLLASRPVIPNTGIRTLDLSDSFYKNYYEATVLAYQKISGLPELYYNPRDSLFPRILAFTKANPDIVYELFTYGYLNYLYPSLSLIELQHFPSSLKHAIKQFGQQEYICLRIFTISPEKDEDTIYPSIHLIEITHVTRAGTTTKLPTIAAEKNKHYKTPHFDKGWINYRRSTGALAIKCQSERLMTKGARTLYSDKNLILVTTEGAGNISVDEQLFDFSYALEPKKFLGSPAVRTKFAELYKVEQDKAQKQILT